MMILSIFLIILKNCFNFLKGEKMKTKDLIVENERLRNELISKIVVFLGNATVDYVRFALVSFGYDYDLILYTEKPLTDPYGDPVEKFNGKLLKKIKFKYKDYPKNEKDEYNTIFVYIDDFIKAEIKNDDKNFLFIADRIKNLVYQYKNKKLQDDINLFTQSNE